MLCCRVAYKHGGEDFQGWHATLWDFRACGTLFDDAHTEATMRAAFAAMKEEDAKAPKNEQHLADYASFTELLLQARGGWGRVGS